MRVVLCSCPPAAAQTITREIVSSGLAVAVSAVPGTRRTSTLDPEPAEHAETLLLAHTTPARVQRLIERIAELHPSPAPEIVALPVLAGHRAFLELAEREEGEPADSRPDAPDPFLQDDGHPF
jgi:periplasmic divalent cation tolerance protein